MKENGGVSSALNYGIRVMSGDYFSWLSHDDVYEPDKIEKQITVLSNHGFDENILVYCNYMLINDVSKPISRQKNKLCFTPNKLYQSDEVLMELLKKASFNGCCLLIPRKALIDCGLFYENLRFCQDVFMWYKIFMKNYTLLCTDDISVKNRVHAKQLTQTGQSLFRKECEKISTVLANEFAKISTEEHNFFRMYLFSDARYFNFCRAKEIVAIGKEKHLVSTSDILKVMFICGYGYIRPIIRKIYYAVFRGMKTV